MAPATRHTALSPRMWAGATLLMAASVACAGDPLPSAPTESPERDADVTVAALEWRFVPARLSADAGDQLTVELRNDGAVIHNWTVLSEPVMTESGYRESLRIVAVEAGPGALDSVTFEVPSPGDYQIICTIPGHLSSGMEGVLSVGSG